MNYRSQRTSRRLDGPVYDKSHTDHSGNAAIELTLLTFFMDPQASIRWDDVPALHYVHIDLSLRTGVHMKRAAPFYFRISVAHIVQTPLVPKGRLCTLFIRRNPIVNSLKPHSDRQCLYEVSPRINIRIQSLTQRMPAVCVFP